ncbi:MAG: glycosyltransferase, partial [candidate division WOR-3 bacterium]|nr:glycosyltransferase [candidate division WOR-3 bacterium]
YAKKCLKLIKNRPKTIVISDLDYANPILASAYAACDTFILPSYYETPGLSALEAGLAGAKVVITQFGGTKEYFKEYAHYINPYSVSSIRKTLEEALNKKKNSLLQNHIRQNYLWQKSAKVLIDIYKSI